MVLTLHMEKQDPRGMRINYTFVDAISKTVVATATDYIEEMRSLYFNGDKYSFSSYPKFVEKPEYQFKYPASTRMKKTVGFPILCNNEQCAYFYGDALTCRKKRLFRKSNIGVTVFRIFGQAYLLFKVGFSNESSHYFCLYNDTGDLVSVIERVNENEGNRKAILYVQDSQYLLATLIASTEEIIMVINSGDRESIKDSSAGNYISIMEEEKALFDRSFVEDIKANYRYYEQ